MTKFETELKMAVKSSDLARRTWRVLKIALLFYRRFIKKVGRSVKSIGGEKPSARILLAERQLSFGKSPDVHVKMHRPASMRFLFPCINSGPDLDGGFSDDEIDLRAQKFIDEFYQQLKLQSPAIKVYTE